jgi:ankyrin repeat protein
MYFVRCLYAREATPFASDRSRLLVAPVGKEEVMIKTVATVLVASVIAIAAWAGGVVGATAAILQGGSAEDTALRDAALFHNIEDVKDALKKGANANAPSAQRRHTTPLGAVAMGGSWRQSRDRAADLAKNETARKLSQRGLSDEEIDRYLAVEIIKTLFAAGAKLGPYDRIVLFQPIADGNTALVGLLLDHGASVTGDLEGYTPTELAKKYGQEAVYQLLVSRGGIPVDTSSAAQLALVEAAGTGDVERMEKALKDGARINEVKSQQTALIAALRLPTVDPRWSVAVWWLLDHGADPNLKSDDGLPLHVFISANAKTMNGSDFERDLADITVGRLLKAGAKVSGMDDDGQTPLHVAAKYNNMEAAEILIREGAKIMPRDRTGKTPLDYAESAEMIRLLKSHGAVER